jgi:membrane-associated phospholipid phosphatase
MKSFPSGHSQLALFAAAFFIVFLTFHLKLFHFIVCSQVYSNKRKTGFLLNCVSKFVQLVSLLLALYCAYSRLADHRHHRVDVLTGSGIGIVLGLLTAQTLQLSGGRDKTSFVE